MSDISRYQIPKVKDLMTRRVVSLSPESDLSEAIRLFNKYRISSAPVVEGHSKEIVGFVSEDDLICLMAESSFFYGPIEPFKVQDAMSHELQKLNPEMDLFETVKLFHEKALRHAPVVDEHNHLMGILARRDLLRALEKIFEEQATYQERLKEPKHLSMTEEARWRLSTRQ